jgi:hypothetical protein
MGGIMTKNKKLSIVNLMIYILSFIINVTLVGTVKGNVVEIIGGLFSGGNIGLGEVASAAVMILAMLTLILCGLVAIVNVLLKILQISFDKWGFSVASVVLDSLVFIGTGIISIWHLSGISDQIGGACIALFLASVLALLLECIIITKKKDT